MTSSRPIRSIRPIFFRPLLVLVDFITPGTVESAITNHIAMLHTVFNVLGTLIFLPFVKQLAALTERIIKPKEGEIPTDYHLEFVASTLLGNTEAQVIRAEKEIADMADLATRMFKRIKSGFDDLNEQWAMTHLSALSQEEEFADQMQEEISRFLVHCSSLPITPKLRAHITALLHIVEDLENMTDDCYSVALLLQRSIDKKMVFDKDDIDRLHPYTDLAQQFLEFIS